MPVEIRELIIRATVEARAAEQPAGPGPKTEVDRKRIVAECVEQVLEVLRRKQER